MNRFVIHEHNAKNLHYDFRLEMDNKLKSWAVPKNLPKEIGVRRLAISVEDHPISYINFEGEIPKGQYGAGKVKIYDSGTYELINKDDNNIHFILKGKTINGEYNMIPFKDDWLIMKVK